MKKIIFALFAMVLMAGTVTVSAESFQEHYARIEKKQKKNAKNAAKEAVKDNWKAWEGAATIEAQMLDNLTRENMRIVDEEDYSGDDGEPMFYFGTATYTTSDKGMAYKAAVQNAMQDLATKLETDLAAGFSQEDMTKNEVAFRKANDQMKSVVTKKLAGVKPTVQMYKRSGEKYTVQLTICYSKKKADKVAAEAMRAAMEQEGDPALTALVDEALAKQLGKNK